MDCEHIAEGNCLLSNENFQTEKNPECTDGTNFDQNCSQNRNEDQGHKPMAYTSSGPVYREQYKDSLAQNRMIGMKYEDTLYPVGDFKGKSLTHTDFYRPSPVVDTSGTKRPLRGLELPPFEGITSHQSDYRPPFFGQKVKVPPVSLFCTENGDTSSRDQKTKKTSTEVDDIKHGEFLKDIRRMDYGTTQQTSFRPLPEWGYVKERAPMYKLPIMKFAKSDKSYKYCSVTKSDYVYFNIDPTKREYVIGEPEMININPHPMPKF